jgi:hypothetical protein
MATGSSLANRVPDNSRGHPSLNTIIFTDDRFILRDYRDTLYSTQFDANVVLDGARDELIPTNPDHEIPTNPDHEILSATTE